MIKKIFPALISLCAANCQAGQDTALYSLNKGQKLTGVIAEGVATRIEFGLLGFREIIGDESQYTFITDQNHRSIFLTPKVPTGQNIAISLINKAGEIADLDLKVQKTEGQGQVIKIAKKVSDQDYSNHIHDQEVISMIRAMQKDTDSDGKYCVLSDRRNIPGNMKDIGLYQDRTYRYSNLNLVGSRLVVTNLSKGLKELHHSDFKNLFENSYAISIQKKVLRAKEKGFVYIIAGEKSYDQ